LGWSRAALTGAFSPALLLSGVAGVPVGRAGWTVTLPQEWCDGGKAFAHADGAGAATRTARAGRKAALRCLPAGPANAGSEIDSPPSAGRRQTGGASPRRYSGTRRFRS